jgi:SET domain-containing protein
MNHSFAPNCIEWFVDHPRFGVIPCERTTRPVRAGEELFLDYEYDPCNCPPWFSEALERHVLEARNNGVEEDELALNKKYAKFVELELGANKT